MRQRPSPPPPLSNDEAVERFEDAARKLRERFKSSVADALPGIARGLLEQELHEVADLQSIDSIPSLALAYLLSCERCVLDLLNKNYEGVASSYFEKCVSETANDIRAKVITSRSYVNDVISISAERTAW
jgi:hypothetical protein